MRPNDADRIPVLVGVGQSIERERVVSVLDLIERAARAALEDAPGLESYIDRVTTIMAVFSPCGRAPSTEMVGRLHLDGVSCEMTTAGGNMPVWAVTRAAAAVAAGELRATLIVGAEATRSLRASTPDTDFLAVSRRTALGQGDPDSVAGPSMDGVLSSAELAAGFVRPAEMAPAARERLDDSPAIRSADGAVFSAVRRSIDESISSISIPVFRRRSRWVPRLSAWPSTMSAGPR